MIDRAPHFLLDGQAGWRAATLDKTDVSTGALRLQALPGTATPLVDSTGSFGGLQCAAGVAVDNEDRVYVLDSAACDVKRFDRCSCKFVALPCIGPRGHEPRKLENPLGIAISCAGNLYIADSGNRRIQIFSLEGLALRQIWGPLRVKRSDKGIGVIAAAPTPSPGSCDMSWTYPEGTWLPWDVVVTNRGWAYVSDYANGLIHVFDPRGCWSTAFEGLPELVKPTRITVDRQGHIYVIQDGLDYVVTFDDHGKQLGTVSKPGEVSGAFCPVAIAVDLHGNLCLSDCMTRKVYFYQPDGYGGWCPSKCSPDYMQSLVFDRSGKGLFTSGSCGVCELQPNGVYPASGVFYTAPLDSKTYRCVWDRVGMVGSVPAGTSIRVDTFTAEAEKTPDEIVNLPAGRWSTGQIHTTTDAKAWDCLIQGQPGRYLWLRLTLSSDGSDSPGIEGVKIHYPRSSSLKYLPAVYRADPFSGDFLDRFLSIFDSMRRKTDGKITDIAHYFDPCATPANKPGLGPDDFLAWLAMWMGMTLKNGWPIAKRRRLLKNAHKLYALRGTPAGLRLHIELYAGVGPRILELFKLRRWLSVDHSTLGNDSMISGDSPLNRLRIAVNSTIGQFQLIDYGDPKLDLFNRYAYQFRVVVPRWPGAGAADQQSLEQIIEMAKPAHTVAEFQWAEPRLRIGLQSSLGIDTVIARYPMGVIEAQGKLGYDTVLGSPEDRGTPRMSVGRSSVIGCNSVLA
jgi:phage tail-like protein